MKHIRLVSFLLAMLILIISLASCNILPWLKDDKNVTIKIEYYIDGKLENSETLTTKDLAKTERYSPEDREGYRFIGWFIDPACEIPYTTADLTDSGEKTVKLYGKFLPIGGGVAGCDHFWILGYCRICGAVCAHEWKNAICAICDSPCDHGSTEIGKTCKTCGKELKANKIRVVIGAPDEQEESSYATIEFDTAMYVDEILAHCMTYWGYKFRNEIFDIWVDGTLITDTSTLITKDCTLLATLKEDVIRVNVTMVDSQGDKNDQLIYLPKEGLTLERFGLIVFPKTGGFAHLLNTVTININGQDITDGSYHINKPCNITLTEKSKEDPETFTLTLVMAKTGETYKGQFTIYEAKESSLAKLISRISGFDFYDLLSRGYITVNGKEIYSDTPIFDQNTEVIFTELDKGQIRIQFSALGDMGASEINEEKAVIVNTGSTYEEVVHKMLGLTWEEYEDRYFSTQTGDRVSIHRDTVLSESMYISAIIYRNHEITDKVTLSVQFQFDDVGITQIEVDYGTLLSEALDMIGVNFYELLKEGNTLFSFNIRPLVSDVKLKYNSSLLAWKTCTDHEWEQRQCTKCGTVCNYEYYENISCPVCKGYHPTSKEDTIMVSLLVYMYGGTYYIDNGTTLGEFLSNLRLTDVGMKMVEKGFVELNFKPITDMNTVLSNGDKIICNSSVCGHTDDVDEFCTICIEFCEHEWLDRGCIVCGRQCFNEYESGDCPICDSYHPKQDQDDDKKAIVHFYMFDEGGHMMDDGQPIEIESGESFKSVFERYLGDQIYAMMGHGYFIVNNTVITNDNISTIYLYNGTKVEFHHGKYCDHQWNDDGICMNCYQECAHTWSNGFCTICDTSCPHDWVNNVCTMCGMVQQNNPPKDLTYTYVEDTPLKQVTKSGLKIENGATVFEVLTAVGGPDHDKLIYRKEVYINGMLVEDGNMELTEDFTIKIYRTKENCIHSFGKEDVCSYCGCNSSDYQPPECVHEWSNSKCTKCYMWCNGNVFDDTLKHTFVNGKCSNCGCTYGGDDHYIYVVWANVDPYYVLYSTTFAEYCEIAHIQADYAQYNYYQSTLSYLEHPDTERRELTPETVLGEFGNNTHVNCETLNTGAGHTCEWYNSACVLCALRCDHNFNANGKCTICNCTYAGEDHYITVTTDYWGNGVHNAFVSTKFVPYSTTLYDLLEETWEAGYSYAITQYIFLIDGVQLSSSTVLGKYGNSVEISTLAITQN